MALPDIQLDDRTFEQLQIELRRRIPAYTPEWTDHNESDPGITLMQLFAWLGEMIHKGEAMGQLPPDMGFTPTGKSPSPTTDDEPLAEAGRTTVVTPKAGLAPGS